MDNSLSESARFAVYREKLKGICEANNLSYVFIKNAYPIKLVIRPLGGVGEQMSMLEEATEDNYISPGASILFTVKDGNLTYRMSKTFTISDTLFNKIKNIFKNMHYLWLQFFFRDLVEGGKLAALGYKMPDIPESGGQQDAPRGNEPDSPNLPGEAEPLEEIEDDEENEPTSDELTQATEIARQNDGITEKAKASTPAGAEPKRVQRKEIHKGTAYGVLRLRCPKCGDVFGRFLREPSASVTCRCGGEVQLDNLTRYEFTCPCCDFEARGRTNLEDPEITVPCKCGNPVTMKLDRNKRMYHE